MGKIGNRLKTKSMTFEEATKELEEKFGSEVSESFSKQAVHFNDTWDLQFWVLSFSNWDKTKEGIDFWYDIFMRC